MIGAVKVKNIYLAIMGKSGAGKDTACYILNSYGYKSIVAYTTRPMRTGEVDGVNYYFVTQEKFDELKESGFFAETRTYNAKFGTCSYGTAKQSFSNEGKYYFIITPEGLYNMLKGEKLDIIPVYMRTTDYTLEKRLFVRLEDETDEETKNTLRAEITRRLGTDGGDFAPLDDPNSDYCRAFNNMVVIDTDGKTPEEVVKTLIDIVERDL